MRTHGELQAFVRREFIQFFLHISPHKLNRHNVVAGGLPSPPVESACVDDLRCIAPMHILRPHLLLMNSLVDLGARGK